MTHNQLEPQRVVFVCTGNTCRSPFAQFVAAHMDARAPAAPPVSYSSAGTHVPSDLGFDAQMESALRTLIPGLESDRDFHSRQLDSHLVRDSDVLVAMTREHHDWIVQSFPEAAPATAVLKPYARACSELGVRGWDPDLIAALAAGQHPQVFTDTFRDDVADPYRLGLSEAQKAAKEIGGLLRSLLE